VHILNFEAEPDVLEGRNMLYIFANCYISLSGMLICSRIACHIFLGSRITCNEFFNLYHVEIACLGIQITIEAINDQF
jgi:hypothetical protein